MAKETTTTFEITVTHRGGSKSFEKLFKPKGGQTKLQTKTVDSATYQSETHAKYTNEQKMVRLLLKKCCEAASLNYMGVKAKWNSQGGYAIDYGNCRKNGSYANYAISLNSVRFTLRFNNGLDSAGELSIFDSKDVKYETNPNNSAMWRRQMVVGNEVYKVNLADPEFQQFLTELLKLWGNKYN